VYTPAEVRALTPVRDSVENDIIIVMVMMIIISGMMAMPHA
jgi:hypothetical protein